LDQPLGKAAQAALKQWSNQNPQVQLMPLRQQSSWLIAEVFAANHSAQTQMVNQTLVQAGLACVYSPYIEECPHRRAIIQAETVAKQHQQGQWHHPDFSSPWDHRRWRIVQQLKQQLSSDQVLNPLPPSYLHDGMQNATVGLASWYGPVLQGRLTANGETFDQQALTAAHPSLPFNTQLRVTNLQNQQSVIVRINDRQPAQNISMLDLSKAAAEKIDAVEDGIVPVEIKILWGGR
jgi:rare lipoprotein A (peptidoglycan hydrolase)